MAQLWHGAALLPCLVIASGFPDFPWKEEDLDAYSGAAYGGTAYGGTAYGGAKDLAKDLFGARPYSGYTPEVPELHEDDCSRIEAHGIPLADKLREAALHLGDASLGITSPEVQQLVGFFAGDSRRNFLLAHCPQSVVLAWLLQANTSDEGGGEELARSVEKLLESAVELRVLSRPPPRWFDQAWEEALQAAQRRTGIVLFPVGESFFRVEHISPVKWLIHTKRHCVGRRDLGNLQSTPLATCLRKCADHPLCTSATFWHWQPGGLGFEQRCFLSSTCTSEKATAEGALGAVLFEKLDVPSLAVRDEIQRTIVGHGTSPWAPRCGHRVLATGRPGRPPAPGSDTRLWLLGGVGVDPFRNHSATEEAEAENRPPFGPLPPPDHPEYFKEMARARTAALRHEKRGTGRASSKIRSQGNKSGSVVEAYLSRHVELSGDLPPLRSLPYGRLSDIWSSDDLGKTWTLSMEKAPWGARAFFEAVSRPDGTAILLLGGMCETGELKPESSLEPAVPQREYKNDVWWFDATASADNWQELSVAPWEPRASFRAVLRQVPQGPSANLVEEIVVLGGRVANGSLTNDVWTAPVYATSGTLGGWSLRAALAAWSPRADFAAAAASWSDLWVMGGCDEAGRALSDVWRSTDGQSWELVQQAAPWGSRVGAVAVGLDHLPGTVALYGGFAFADADIGIVPAVEAGEPPSWSTAAWTSHDGMHWQPISNSRLVRLPMKKHASILTAPCSQGAGDDMCLYVVGGVNEEGYYDNSVHRSEVWAPANVSEEQPVADRELRQAAASFDLALDDGPLGVPAVGCAALAATLLVLWRCARLSKSPPTRPSKWLPAEPAVRALFVLMLCICALSLVVAGYAIRALAALQSDILELRRQPSECHVNEELVQKMWGALGLQEASERWSHMETLLRLAARESQFSYAGLGGAYDAWRGMRGTGNSYGGGYAEERDPYGYGSGYHDYASGGYGSGYYDYASYAGLASYYGPYGGLYPKELDSPSSFAPPTPQEQEAARARELATLPTTQSMSCRSPRCDRNASMCNKSASRSLATPHGCCSDYMLLMLSDVTDWLSQQEIPYFITYGTLLGALREEDIIPYTQDLDIVVDRAHWPRLQRGLEAAEFFGGRRYLFGVDQWEERVSRVCADWDGFATVQVGRAEFHLDIYASDWWQIVDQHLVDCVEPLGAKTLPIRGKNFSAPARPRECVEKLYGAEWRVPKRGLSGVN